MSKEQEQLERDQWRALVRGKENALEWLFDNFSQSLFNYGMQVSHDREIVKDCIQDLFSDIWKNRSRLIVPQSPKFYLFKSLKYKILRASARQHKKDANAAWEAENEIELSVESIMISEQTAIEHRSAIQNALNKLTQRQREVLMLRYFEDMSHDDIADLLQINKQSVYNLIFSALVSLKKALLFELNLLNLLLTGLVTIGVCC